MSSPFSSTDPAGAAHNAARFVVDPHIETAVWAIVLAIAGALVLIIAEMVKRRDAVPAPPERNDPEEPR